MAYDILKNYLAHCYLYYNRSESVISDHEFDDLCKEIANTWDNIQSPYKELVLKLEGGRENIHRIKGTEFYPKDIPEVIKRFAQSLVDQKKEESEIFGA